MGIFTELGVLYSKYKEEKLMEHVKLFWSRVNIRKMLKACEENAQWEELVFLHLHHDEFDNAALAMIAHPTEAWEHLKFKARADPHPRRPRALPPDRLAAAAARRRTRSRS